MDTEDQTANCPHCEHAVAGADEFCPSCNRILPVPEQESYYQVLGYEKEWLEMDSADLEKRYLQLSKKFHPDRFAAGSDLEIMLSHDRSSAVNNAYRTLKNPISRAKHVLETHLGTNEEKSASVPVDMAEFFFEVQEDLETLQDSEEKDPDVVQRVLNAEKELIESVEALEADLKKDFAAYDTGGGNDTLLEIREKLAKRSYIQSFLRQVDATLKRDV